MYLQIMHCIIIFIHNNVLRCICLHTYVLQVEERPADGRAGGGALPDSRAARGAAPLRHRTNFSEGNLRHKPLLSPQQQPAIRLSGR